MSNQNSDAADGPGARRAQPEPNATQPMDPVPGGGYPPPVEPLDAPEEEKPSRLPLIIGIVCGLLWRLTGLPLPSLAARFVDGLGSIAGPLALFSMGLGLRRYGISGNLRAGFTLAALKLFVMPAIALGMVLLFGLPPLAASVVVLTAALPAGVNCYLIAVQFGTGQALASNMITIATGLGVATTAFWITVLHAIFG